MKIKLLIILGFYFFLPVLAMGQKVLLEMETRNLYQKKWGPNLRHFGQIVLTTATFIPMSENEKNISGIFSSNQFAIGYRYKLKINPRLSCGTEGITRFSFHKLNSEFNLQRNQNYPFDAISYCTPFANFYVRLQNVTGNQIAFFADMGISAGRNILYQFYLINHEKHYTLITNKNFNEEIFEKWYTAIITRLGYRNLALITTYRFSGFFKGNIPEVPSTDTGIPFRISAFSVGLELGI